MLSLLDSDRIGVAHAKLRPQTGLGLSSTIFALVQQEGCLLSAKTHPKENTMHDSLGQIIHPIRIAGILLVSFLMAWGITRAASASFKTRGDQIHKQALADQQRLGLDLTTPCMRHTRN